MKMSPKQSPNGVAPSSSLPGITLTQPTKVSGSIMQGTPVSSSNIYQSALLYHREDMFKTPPPVPLQQLSREMMTPPPLIKESAGSITQGKLPVASSLRERMSLSRIFYAILLLFLGTPVHQRNSHSNSSAEYYPQTNSKRGNTLPATSFYPNRHHSYNDEQRHHIVMADFMTANKMRSMQHHKNIQPPPPHENPEYYPGGRQGEK